MGREKTKKRDDKVARICSPLLGRIGCGTDLDAMERLNTVLGMLW